MSAPENEAGKAAGHAAQDQPVSAPDPMRGFRGVMAVALVLEFIVVLLALPVLAKLGDGLATWQGVLIGVLALAMLLLCGMLGRPWALSAAIVLQVVMVACWFAVPALGILGLVFLAIWLILWWMRRDVLRRMAEGRLTSQRPAER